MFCRECCSARILSKHEPDAQHQVPKNNVKAIRTFSDVLSGLCTKGCCEVLDAEVCLTWYTCRAFSLARAQTGYCKCNIFVFLYHTFVNILFEIALLVSVVNEL